MSGDSLLLEDGISYLLFEDSISHFLLEVQTGGTGGTGVTGGTVKGGTTTTISATQVPYDNFLPEVLPNIP
jgi:hypothetical protein